MDVHFNLAVLQVDVAAVSALLHCRVEVVHAFHSHGYLASCNAKPLSVTWLMSFFQLSFFPSKRC
jgi:hypothetical protein